MIYFDNAATTFPKPRAVVEKVQQSFVAFGANPGRSGHKLSATAGQMIYECREKTAELFGAEGAEQVIFTGNCTESINIVLKGLLQKGDHVIISDLEHNAMARPLEKLRLNSGVSYDCAEVVEGDDEATVRNFRALIRSNTKLIAVTHVSNVFGIQLPIGQIGALCKEKNILFMVDAAQSAGVFPIHMESMHIDYLCMPGHKGLYGPMGTGILILRAKEMLDTLQEGGTGSTSLDLVQPDFLPDRFESGTLNTPGIAGLSAGIDFVKKIGIQSFYDHEFELISYARTKLQQEEKVLFYNAAPEYGKSAPVLSFNIKGAQSFEVADFLDKRAIAVRGGYHCSALAHRKMGTLDSGTVRMSTGIFNHKKEVLIFCEALLKGAVKRF